MKTWHALETSGVAIERRAELSFQRWQQLLLAHVVGDGAEEDSSE